MLLDSAKQRGMVDYDTRVTTIDSEHEPRYYQYAFQPFPNFWKKILGLELTLVR